MEERSELKRELSEVILKEDRAIKMKSKFTWAKGGDANTKLFHRFVNSRKARNSISRLETIDGRSIEGEEVFECDGNTSPGSDCYSLSLFQSCWEMVKNDLVEVLEECHSNGVINGITNETYIALIPKKINSCKISDFRPKSLVTSLYKIIAKVLVSRLKNVWRVGFRRRKGLPLPTEKS